MRVRIFAYDNASASAKALSKELGAKLLRHENSTFVARADDIIINWGHTGDKLNGSRANIINEPANNAIASNKLKFFQRVTEWNNNNPNEVINIPEYTTSRETAIQWVTSREVLCRTVLNGHSGEGITIARDADSIINAPLYVKYVPKRKEFRVHCANGRIFDIAQKIKDPNREVIDFYIRNHDAGFIFARDNIEVPASVPEQAARAMRASGLDFGAVDIIWNQKQDKSYVLEINTAPGLVGTTLTNYTNALKQMIGG